MGHLVMSEKERLRKAIFEMVKQKKLTLVMAAKQCGMSYRQVSRAYRRYLEKGDAGLIHQGRGRSSNRKHPYREAILVRYQACYEGFGPTLAAEKLAEEDGLPVDHDTLRQWLLAEGLWQRQRKRTPYRQRRERRAQLGELVQVDGSLHDWFEEGRLRCLMNMVDDATGKTWARLESGETTAAVFRILWQWIARYGIPLALYVDLKTVYVSPRQAGGFSHVERACAKLGIRIQKAYSPQAKGRVERNHAVYQDRFVKELRLKNIKTEQAANQLLENGFIDRLNQKFEKPARDPQPAHRPLNGLNLDQILCWEYERQVQNDWTFSFEGNCYQIEKTQPLQVRPKQTIIIRRHLDKSLSVWFKEQPLKYCCIEKPLKPPVQKTGYDLQQRSLLAQQNKHKTPWGQFNPDWLKSKKRVNSNNLVS
jgi:transposase